jgi:hypothetical protein
MHEVRRQYEFEDHPPRASQDAVGRVDRAITSGQIDEKDRNFWLRSFAEYPHLTRRQLDECAPDLAGSDEAYRAAYTARFGEEPFVWNGRASCRSSRSGFAI